MKKDIKQKKKKDCPNGPSIEKEGISEFPQQKVRESIENIDEKEALIQKIEQFFRETFASLIGLEILTFFHRNEYFMDRAEKIAHYIGRDKDLRTVSEVLNKLTEIGLIEKIGEKDSAIYTLNNDLRDTLHEEMSTLLKEKK